MSFTTKEQEKITNSQAATILKLSLRQIKRLKKVVREKGIEALTHQLKGRISNQFGFTKSYLISLSIDPSADSG